MAKTINYTLCNKYAARRSEIFA